LIPIAYTLRQAWILVRSLPTLLYFLASMYRLTTNGGVETVTPSSATARLDATLAPSSVPNGALSTLSAAPEFLLNDELWGDLGLGLSDNWNVVGSSMSWMA
jgi:hypothetical protein